MLTGLILRDQRHYEAEASALEPLADALAQRNLRILTQTSGIGMFPPDRSFAGSVYLPEGFGSFELIAVGRNNRLFQNPWSQAFLEHLNDLLCDEGRLVLPFLDDERAERDGAWSRSALTDLFRDDGETIADVFVGVTRRHDMPQTPSVLRWFLENSAQIIHSHLLIRHVRHSINVQRIDDLFLEFAFDSAERITARPRTWVEEGEVLADSKWFDTATEGEMNRPILYGREFSAALRSLSYLISGVNPKTALLRHLITTYCSDGRADSVLDVGGAYGYLVAELLLDPELGLSQGVVCDFDSAYLAGAGRLYRDLRASLQGRFFFSLNPAQAFPFDRSFSVITFMSSLLYVPKDEREALIDRCWEHLEPGGILVIYEALRSDPPVKDDAIQFTAAELDSFLSRWGEVHRHSGTSIRPVTADEAAEHTIFRVVAKPA